jgi:hypothetical protein
MKHDAKARYLARDRILSLLSDSEVARVSTAESAPRLAPGDEYLDLEALDQGVKRAIGTRIPMGHVLPKKAVNEATWGKILRELASAEVSAPHSGGRVDDAD